uniref:Reverse transcriptase Ty1/copia-type domain-containing protein n=1 Tax=Hyaloperonospora arabidopsidis (strain Emoy2) TaxID=559515 RepID=M4BNX8_HYAAE
MAIRKREKFSVQERRARSYRCDVRVASDEVIIAAFDRNPRNYSKAMHSSKCMEWQTEMHDEIAALDSSRRRLEPDVRCRDGHFDGEGRAGARSDVGRAGKARGYPERVRTCRERSPPRHLAGGSAWHDGVRQHAARSWRGECRRGCPRAAKEPVWIKQAGRLRSQLLPARLSDVSSTRCVTDICVYHKRDGDELVVIGVYVDDLLATGKSIAAV